MSHVTVTVSFNTEKHADLLAWLNDGSNRSDKIRRACEAVFRNQGSVTLLDVLRAIEDLQHVGIIVRERDKARDDGDEPAEAVLALNRLGL